MVTRPDESPWLPDRRRRERPVVALPGFRRRRVLKIRLTRFHQLWHR
jgi:hypothetical protein